MPCQSSVLVIQLSMLATVYFFFWTVTDVHQDMLETVVPKTHHPVVKIVRGKNRNTVRLEGRGGLAWWYCMDDEIAPLRPLPLRGHLSKMTASPP